MDRYRDHANRSSTVGDTTEPKYKRRNYITGKRILDANDYKIGVSKILDEVTERKDRGLGDGSSLYLQRRYN